MQEELKDFTKGRDLDPALTLMKGNFSTMKEIAPNVSDAQAYLQRILFSEPGRFTIAYLNQDIYHPGVFDLLHAPTFEGQTMGLLQVLRDAGYKKGDVGEYLLTENSKQGEAMTSTEKLSQLIASVYSESKDKQNS